MSVTSTEDKGIEIINYSQVVLLIFLSSLIKFLLILFLHIDRYFQIALTE